jgi:hypothetical protein
MAQAVAERRPMAVVLPDGSDVVSRPPENHGLSLLIVRGLVWVADRLRRGRLQPAAVPCAWVTEFYAAGREPQALA